MILYKMQEMVGGWFVGDFEPSAYKTKDFEVCYKKHPKGEIWPNHYHTTTEINYIISGMMMANDTLLKKGDIFVVEPFESIYPTFLEDCELIVVKNKSVKNDKYIVE
jgi:mannose-6-phosphate isomerase-like protein (cupin superfamily)